MARTKRRKENPEYDATVEDKMFKKPPLVESSFWENTTVAFSCEGKRTVVLDGDLYTKERFLDEFGGRPFYQKNKNEAIFSFCNGRVGARIITHVNIWLRNELDDGTRSAKIILRDSNFEVQARLPCIWTILYLAEARAAALTLLQIRRFRVSELNIFPLDIIRLIAKCVYASAASIEWKK